MTNTSDEILDMMNVAGAAGISPTRIADNAGIAPSTVTRWWNGVTRPHPSMLRLAQASLNDLLDRAKNE